MEHGRGGPLRRQGHEDAALRLSHHAPITAVPTTPTAARTTGPTCTTASRTTTRCRRRTTPTTRVRRSGATIVMVAGVKYLMSKDGSYSKQTTSSDGKTVVSVGAGPTGREHQDAAGPARARDRRRHHVLRERQRVLPACHERDAGELRRGDAARRCRVRSRAAAPTSRSCSSTRCTSRPTASTTCRISPPDGKELYVMVDAAADAAARRPDRVLAT